MINATVTNHTNKGYRFAQGGMIPGLSPDQTKRALTNYDQSKLLKKAIKDQREEKENGK